MSKHGSSASEDYAKLDAAIESILILLRRTRGTDEELFRAASCVYDYLVDQENKRMLAEHDPFGWNED